MNQDQESQSQESETNLLAVQKSMLDTLSILMHHDAITGTHMLKTGQDYRNMMQGAIDASLSTGTKPL